VERLIALGDARARDPEVAGHKAAELARAAAAEMPVLPGWVLPLRESAAVLALGAACGRDGSSARSILAISAVELDRGLARELSAVVRSLGGSVVVRSSSPLEADPRWSGAFATYLDVGADDVGAAVRGCWASAFSRDVLARGERLSLDPHERGIAVLIQPWVAFAGGGVAAIEPDGRVRISATRGAPAGLLGGRDRGMSIELGADGGPEEGSQSDGIALDMIAAAGELARRVKGSIGNDTIEWGWLAGVVTLLQARRAPKSVVTGAATARHRRFPPVAARMARVAASHPGLLGERWVLPWALALERLPRPAHVAVHDVSTAVAEAARLSADLTASVWGAAGDRFETARATSFRAVLGPAPSDELMRLSTLRSPDPAQAARLLGLLTGIGDALHVAGSFPRADHIWWVSPDDLERAATDGIVPARIGRGRWEPFVFSVVQDRGHRLPGRPASPGIGAGRSFPFDGSPRALPPPRCVLVVRAVVPQLASLLWDAAGLVVREGNEGAHLFEVARSLGVPAVIGVDPGAMDGCVVAVNGDDGFVSVLEAARDARILEGRTG
jgi:hypothetical protein